MWRRRVTFLIGCERDKLMHSSGSMRAQIGTLIIATSIIQLANGFFNTYISLRVASEPTSRISSSN